MTSSFKRCPDCGVMFLGEVCPNCEIIFQETLKREVNKDVFSKEVEKYGI